MYREKHWQLLDMDIPMACQIRKMALHSWRVTSLLCPMKSVQKSLAPQAHVCILHPLEWSLSKLFTYAVNKDQLTHAVEIVEVKKPVNIGERLRESFQWRPLTIGNIDITFPKCWVTPYQGHSLVYSLYSYLSLFCFPFPTSCFPLPALASCL